MSNRGVAFLISVLIVMACLGVSVWLVVSGQAGYVDGLFLLLTCLLLALAFGLYLMYLVKAAIQEFEPPPSASKPATASQQKPAAVEKASPVGAEKAD